MVEQGAVRPRRGLADKRRAIVEGALTVFARDGYTRASIDAIAGKAGVSTRTIYNHFDDKARLFEAVIQESATRVAEAQIDMMDRHLAKVTDLEADLVGFARAWSAPMAEYAPHFAMVRQIMAEVGHIPPAALDAWQETGPLRVRRELALRMRRLADQGTLRVGDAERAAVHFVSLVTADFPNRGSVPPSETEIDEIVTAGVRAFLHGYLA